MGTIRRLTEVYENARVEYIDENSKYIFFSDCHRGDGNHSDEFLKNQIIYLYALEYYFQKGFFYVEAGDGDELWEYPKFDYIKEAHYDVFETLKKFYNEDRFILLFGNHNIYLKNPEYVEKNYYNYYDQHQAANYDLLKGIRPCEALVLKNKKSGQDILVVHGHQGDFTNDRFWYFSMLTLKYFWRHLHAFGIKNPTSPVKNAHKRLKIERNYNKWIETHQTMLICGHTHRFEYPKAGELPYFNIGCCIFPASITGIEIADGQIQLVQWKNRFHADGTHMIQRNILMGPEPLEKFDMKKAAGVSAG